ncbi:MAG: M24 family metallopeptidase C-terminal domain-containing protein, partial [Bacteroidales bacterium]|nr:M24 family metallopeptidase C-terminal domain-containing protein [Bacteroidales bacterium]
HEGPQSIRRDVNPVKLEEGMLISNEPGIYREGEYGIRIENIILVTKTVKTEFGDFFSFETLTLFPFDKKLINFALLNNEELEWIENYHKKVYNSLSPFLNETEINWLKQKIEQNYIKS